MFLVETNTDVLKRNSDMEFDNTNDRGTFWNSLPLTLSLPLSKDSVQP